MNIREFHSGEEKIIWTICQIAFTGYPWFETMSDEVIKDRWQHKNHYANFRCYVAEDNGTVVGVSWFHEMNKQEIRDAKGESLEKFVLNYFPQLPRMWVDATVIHPDHQGRGIATQLKVSVLKAIRSIFQHVLVVTRMRDDNTGIIRVNEKFGFKRTGIKIPTDKPEIFHEFWYLQL